VAYALGVFRQISIEQRGTIAQRWVFDDFFKELPVFLKFRHPFPVEPVGFAVGTKLVMGQFFVQLFQNAFAIINGLINGMAQVGNEGVVKAFAQLVQLVLFFHQNVIFQAVINALGFTLQPAHGFEETDRVFLAIIRRVNNGIQGLAAQIVFGNVALNFISGGIEFLADALALVFNHLGRAVGGFGISGLQARFGIKLRPYRYDMAQGFFFVVGNLRSGFLLVAELFALFFAV